MNKYKRNIQQIRDRGESAEMYFLDKTISECDELKESTNLFKYGNILKIPLTYETENLYGEIADVLNCIEYLTILFDLDRNKIENIRNYKLDRGYERGKETNE